MFSKKNNKKGFTLMEMLIVVAIIVILIAIMIPTFNGQLEKTREAADAANIRATYAELMVDYLNDGGEQTDTVTLQQTGDGWANEELGKNLEQLAGEDGTVEGEPSANGNCTITVSSEGAVTFSFS